MKRKPIIKVVKDSIDEKILKDFYDDSIQFKYVDDMPKEKIEGNTNDLYKEYLIEHCLD